MLKSSYGRTVVLLLNPIPGRDKEVYTFPKGISLKMSIIRAIGVRTQ